MKVFFYTLLITINAHAKYVEVKKSEIPIQQIIQNLEKKEKENPSNIETKFQLARAYGLAATMTTIQTAKTDNPLSDAIYGKPESVNPMFDGQKKSATEVDYYEKSLSQYNQILSTDPKNYQYILGRGWVYLQLQKIDLARTDFMSIIDDIKPLNPSFIDSFLILIKIKDAPLLLKRKWDFSPFDRFFYKGAIKGYPLIKETIHYLRPLLKETHTDNVILKKIASISNDSTELAFMTPIIFPINKKTSYKDLKNENLYVQFNMDGMDTHTKWQWIKKDAAFLVFLGKSQKKLVSSGKELFGNVTFWIFWNNGYEALDSLDNNRDHYLSGKELEGIFVWNDANEDGVCTPEEIFNLNAFKIKKIATLYKHHKDDIDYNPNGLILESGEFLPTYDWISKSKTEN
nr:tetratricopeptide repeat protein [Bacteriovorax sp. HI3]